jgi:YD repeat-containing protein
LLFAPASHGTIISYRYDGAGRLTTVNYGGGSSSAYTYDKNGNLLTRTDTANHFAPLVGAYTGAITGGSPSVLNTGVITISLAVNGAFTAKITLAGITYPPARGTFDPATGMATVNLTRKTPSGTLTCNLQLVLSSTGQLTGTLTGAESGAVLATIAPFGKAVAVPGGLVGNFTALFEATDSAAIIPQGDGYMTMKVTSSGSVRGAGALGDGAKFSFSSTLAGDETFPLYAALYAKAGFLGGTVAFGTAPGVRDFGGSILWQKPTTAGPVLPAAFSTSVNVVGSKYAAPAKGVRVLALADASPNAVFTTTSGGNGIPSKTLTLDTKNKFTVTTVGSDALKVSVTIPSGLLSGSFNDGTAVRKFQGAVLQRATRGGGYFLGPTTSGAFDLQPAP